jgi:CRISPR-associated endonuclease Csn1
LSSHAKFDSLGKLTLKDIPPPYTGFRDEAKEKIATILISYRNKKRLITTKSNKYVHSRGNKTQQAISIRGPLHEETFFGMINNPHKQNKATYVIRKPITGIENEKHIEKIIDPVIRDLIREQVAQYGGKVKEAMAAGVFMLSKDGKKKIPVKKVRMEENAEELIQLRPNENPKLFVASGSNYLMAIYEKDGKRAFENVSFYEATKRKLVGKPIFPHEKDGKPFLMTVTQKDMVILYDTNPDEIDWSNTKQQFEKLYLVRKMDRNGYIALVKHNLTNINPDKKKLYPAGWTYTKTYSSLRAIKVQISVTGKLERV